MYRVELKEGPSENDPHLGKGLFLMYRVELKVYFETPFGGFNEYVPNVPCGVERCYHLITSPLIHKRS